MIKTKAYLLDTSAILTLMENEAGADTVEQLLRAGDESEHLEGQQQIKMILPFSVLMEAYYITLQEQTEHVADERYALIRQLPCTEIWSVEEPVLMTAARFKATYRLSFADALIAAFVRCYDAVLVHKDPEYQVLQGEIEQEILPYK